MLEKRYPIRPNPLQDSLGDRGFSGTGATGNTNHKRGCEFGHTAIIPAVEYKFPLVDIKRLQILD